MTTVMAGITVATLRSPVFVALFIAGLTQRELKPAMAVAVACSFLLTRNASMLSREEQHTSSLSHESGK